jgi:hypothetical protein
MIHKDHSHLYFEEFFIDNGRERLSRGRVSEQARTP